MKNNFSKVDLAIGDIEQFLDKILSNLATSQINVSKFELDHIAYRTDSSNSYEVLLRLITESYGELMKEAVIRERRVSIIKLSKPIIYHDFDIRYLELMEPATGDEHPNGLEHAEFVVDPNLKSFLALYPETHFTFKDRKVNPELSIKFSNNANIKFHTHDIGEILKLQEQTGEL